MKLTCPDCGADMERFWFFQRDARGPDHPSGVTVSKNPVLPLGEFRITEYTWGTVALWFVDRDNFTAAERRAAANQYGASAQS